MKPNQIADFLNEVVKEVTGGEISVINPETGKEVRQEFIIKEDLSNIVDIGTYIFDNDKWKDNYVKSFINRVGYDVWVNRVYTGYAPNIRRDEWEYGSIMAKSRCRLLEARPNPAWSLEKGQTVDQFEFCPPDVSQKLYNDKDCWEIDCSFADEQLKESIKSPEAMRNFYDMIYNMINTSKTIHMDALIMRTINNFIAYKILYKNGVVDVLSEYNDLVDTPLTAHQAAYNKDFYRFFALKVKQYMERIKAPSHLFNEDPLNVTFTPEEFSHLLIHSDISSGTEIYLQSDTFNEELVKLPKFEPVPFFQSTGYEYDFADTSRICVTIDNNKTIDRNYIIGVIFDYDAVGVANLHERVTSAYNAKGEYYTNFYKVDTHFWNDLAENGIVFVMGNGIPNVTTLPMDQDEEIWGYKVSELQSADFNVSNTKSKISGTLKYISEGALPARWGAGNFMALKWLAIPADATSCKVGIESMVEIIADPERNGTIKVSDTTKKFKIVTTTPRGVKTQEYDLSGLVLEPEPESESESESEPAPAPAASKSRKKKSEE